ncbi:hypothetical protein F5Y11DRAFT_317874 [Daldinia sp. FL1419]|nr:hypothetical protein F5Y11DRAFT_317874 [Daldinia sp. FL1419]
MGSSMRLINANKSFGLRLESGCPPCLPRHLCLSPLLWRSGSTSIGLWANYIDDQYSIFPGRSNQPPPDSYVQCSWMDGGLKRSLAPCELFVLSPVSPFLAESAGERKLVFVCFFSFSFFFPDRTTLVIFAVLRMPSDVIDCPTFCIIAITVLLQMGILVEGCRR